MKRIVALVFFVSCFWLVLLVHHSHAQYDAADPNVSTMGQPRAMEKFVNGTYAKDSEMDAELVEKYFKRLCEWHVKGYVDAEVAKMIHNDDFQEIESEEQIKDVQILRAKFEETSDCIEHFKLWVTHDDKWYRAIREKKWAEIKEQREEWAKQITDTGDDVLDTVLDGTFLSIPREYIWFGSRKSDGVHESVNLQFFYPDLTAKPSSHPDHAGKDRNIGGILVFSRSKALPCPGVPEKKICVESVNSKAARTHIGIRCGTDNPILGEYHYTARLGKCKPRYEITYNEDVGMRQGGLRSGRTTFFEGDINFPDYWVKCRPPPILDGEGQACNSGLILNKNLAFMYSFPRELFWKHREIQEAVRTKLESFIVKKD